MLRQGSFLHADLGLALYAQSACPASALLRAAPCCSPLRCNHRCDMGRKTMSAFAKAKKLQNRMEACLPSHLLQDDNGSNQLVGPFNNASEISHTARSSSGSDGGPLVTSEHAPPPSQQPTQWQCIGADGDASDKVEQLAAASAMANPLRSATAEVLERKCEYTREYVRATMLELRRASGFDAPLPLEWPSHNDGGHRLPLEWPSALATMMVKLQRSGEDVPVMKHSPPKYADFAKSVPPENPFTRAAAQDAEDSNASTHGRGTNQSNISQYNSHCSASQINYHYHAAAPPAAAQPAATPTAPAAVAPPAAAQPAATAPAAAPPAASAPAASAPTATAPAAAPAAAAPPSSEAQQLALREQLADMKAMFEQGLIPSREIYEDKVRQILGLE